MAKEIILGIDLGTTNSVVSYLQALLKRMLKKSSVTPLKDKR